MTTATLTPDTYADSAPKPAGNTENTILSVENLTVSFDGFKAVNNLNLSIEHNELHVIIGPNGAGKTTLLDIICGKTKPSEGRVMFGGTDLTKAAEHQIVRLGVARKFQTPSTYEDLSVLENLEISFPRGRGVVGSLLFRRTRPVCDRIAEIASQIFLSDELDTKAGQLSHGQKQWLEIGMLLIQDPELLLLDEPVAGMSPRERDQTAILLNQISQGKSLIVIEHDMEFVKKIARKVTVMHQGSLLCNGSIEQVQRNERVIEVYLGA